jgi:hypothetical protein
LKGFEGGISLYAFNGYSLFRRNLFGDNTRKFTQNFPEWAVKRIDKRFVGKQKVTTGYVPSETFTNSEEIVNSSKKPAEMVRRLVQSYALGTEEKNKLVEIISNEVVKKFWEKV